MTKSNVAQQICKQYKSDFGAKGQQRDQNYKVDYYIEMCDQQCKDHITGHNWYVTKDEDEFDYDYHLFVFDDDSALQIAYGYDSLKGAFDRCVVIDRNVDGWEVNGSY